MGEIIECNNVECIKERRMKFCNNCNYALSNEEWELARFKTCPNCELCDLSNFYSYGSYGHEQAWRRYMLNVHSFIENENYRVPLPYKELND